MHADFAWLAVGLVGLAAAVALSVCAALVALGWSQARRGDRRALAITGALLGLALLASGAMALSRDWRSPLDPWPALAGVITGPALVGFLLGAILGRLWRR